VQTYATPSHTLSRRGETVAGNMPSAPALEPYQGPLGAQDFRHLVEDFHNGEAEHEDTARRGRNTVAARAGERAKALIDSHGSTKAGAS
jgi:hypothetical protein